MTPPLPPKPVESATSKSPVGPMAMPAGEEKLCTPPALCEIAFEETTVCAPVCGFTRMTPPTLPNALASETSTPP